MSNGAGAFILALVIVVAAFFIFRALVLWYWRVGEIIELLRSIDEKLDRVPPAREPYVS